MIQIPILPDITDEQFAKFCEHFNCKLHKRRRGAVYWIIEADEPINYFWLGANINFHHETGIAISPAAMYLKPQLWKIPKK